MIRTLLALAALAVASLGLASPAAAMQCTQAAIYDNNATGATKLVGGVAAQSIYVCGYTIVSGGTTNVSLKSGTGTNCATGTAAVTPAYSMAAQGHVFDNSPEWRGLTVPAGKDLCINSSGTTIAVQAVIFYRQQ